MPDQRRKGSICQTRLFRVFVFPLLLLSLAATAAACSGGVSKEEHQALQSKLNEAEEQARAATDQLKTLQAKGKNFGITIETFDAKGQPAYEAKQGSALAFIQSGIAYDSPADSNYITVVDVKTRQILTRVAIPMAKGAQSHALGMSAGARWLYLPDFSGISKKLYIVDGLTLKVAKVLDVGAATHHMDEGSYKQIGKFILVDTYNPDHGIIVLDPNNDNAIVGHIPFGTLLGRPYSAWSSPDGSFAYVTVRSPLADQKGWLSKVDLSTFKATAFIPVGVGPVWVAFSADGKTAWVSDSTSNDVLQIKVAQSKEEKDTVAGSVPLNFSPYGITLSADARKLYVVDKTYGATNASTRVAVVDTEAKKVIKEIKVGKQPDHVFLSPDGTEIWVSENRGNGVSIVSVETDEVIGHIPTPGDAHSVRFTIAQVTSSASPGQTGQSPSATPTAKPSPGSAPTVTAGDVVAKGQLLFQRVGCASCHGPGAQGGIGPDIRGRTAEQITGALGSVDAMSFIKLTPEEIQAIAAYLANLSR
ncbi:MAG: c-type cytochrome [Chloroflexi bacterium]|nr:c-type cytochrome [Chloroflexota bacterium]